MSTSNRPFTVQETHGMLRQSGVQIRAASDDLGWTSTYASLQREIPFEAAFGAVADQLVILHLDGPVMVHRRIPKGEDSRLIPAGGMFMMPGGMDFGVRVGGILRTLHLYLRRTLIEEVAADVLNGDPTRVEILPRFGDGDPLIERLMLAVGDVLRDADPTSTPYVDYLSRALAARLIRQHSSMSRDRLGNRAVEALAGSRLGRALEFIEESLGSAVDLPTMAEAAGLSASHFARQFRAAVGRAPHQYLVERRVEHAKRHLDKSTASIAEIAFTCGFANQEHLTRIFKRVCGITPAAYRKARS
jgi:AraC family transcriptional regulator